MRWWRRDGGDDGDDVAEVVSRRLRWVVGPASGVYDAVAEDPDVPVAAPARAAPAAAVGAPPAALPATVALPDPAGARRALAAFDPGRRAVRALAVVAVVVIAIAAVVAWRSRPRAEPVAEPAMPAPGAVASPSAAIIVVSVAGRVQRPGLVRLPAGARVADAIDAAGGVLPGTDLAFVNLARRLVDGELLLIGASPPPGAVPPGPPGATAGGGPVNLNTATAAELDSLPGVGPVLAQQIIDYRTRHGGFRSVAELRKVDGVGDARFAQLKDLVTV